jgi:Tfp pilus assembly protein PilF
MSALANPVAVLLEDHDPVHRSRAHTALGQRALARQDVNTAREHLEEATDLDPTDETPKRLLATLEAPKRRRWFGIF